MSSDSACEREPELILYKGGEEPVRPKRRTKSERRRRERNRPKQRTSPREKLRRSSSVDSGAGGEDEGSLSEGCPSADSNLRLKDSRIDSSNERNRQVRSSFKNIKYKDSVGSSSSKTSAGTLCVASDKDSRQSGYHKGQSDSAISTSTLSTSTVVTSAESPFLSSPNLSDQSKTSSSSPVRPRSPELSRALRRRQERIKRQLDLRETRARLERQRFIEKAYHSNKMMVLTTSLTRRRQLSRSGSLRSNQQTRTSTNGQSFPIGKESRNQLSLNKSAQNGTLVSKLEDKRNPKLEKTDPDGITNECLSSSTSARPNDPKAETHFTRASSPGYKSSSYSTQTKPLLILPVSKDETTTSSSTSKHLSSSRTQTDAVDSADIPAVASYAESRDERKRQKSLRRDGSSRRKPREPGNKEGSSKEGNTIQIKSEMRPKLEAATTSLGSEIAIPSDALSSRSEDDFDKVAKRLENSPRVSNSAEDQVEARMTHAMDAIFRDGMPDMPSLDEITEKGLMDWRSVFRVEMMRLRREVNEFRMYCHQQIEQHGLAIEKSWNSKHPHTPTKDKETDREDTRRRDAPKVSEQLKDLEINMKLFQRKQIILDQETELLEKEDQLAEKVKHLEEYEKEIIEVESMLNQRQAICDRRQRALVTLDEELQSLRQELEDTKDHINSDGSIPESNSERARKNWDMVRRNLMDKQHLLETTVQKYRSELASATSTIAGKDILISRLQSVAMHHEEEMAGRDKRIQQLESKLSISLSETRHLNEQLSGSNRESFSLYGGGGRGSGDGDLHPSSAQRRPSQDPPADNNNSRHSFRGSSAYYRRPSSNAGSEQGEDYGAAKISNGNAGGEGTSSGFGDSSRMNGPRMSRKRNSVSDNAISRLTLSTPRTDDKGSSACTVQ